MGQTRMKIEMYISFENSVFCTYGNEEVTEILKSDDKERFLPLLSGYYDHISMDVVQHVAEFHAKKCLLALIEGEGCAPALELYARLAPHNPRILTPLAAVVYGFHEAHDIIQLLLKQSPVDHPNIKCNRYQDNRFCPLDDLLFRISRISHLRPWDHCASIIKLIILLCQWETKSRLDCARLLIPHTDGLADIAWSYVMEGNLVSLAGLLLAAHEKVLLAKVSGLTIRQRIVHMLSTLRFEDSLDDDGAIYQSMLVDADYLIDIFERAGGALSLYCSSMHEYVPHHKVVADVASILKTAGYTLELRDLDLRDCYRDCPDIKRPSVFKLSDSGSRNNKYLLPTSLTHPQGFRSALQNYPHLGNCQLFHKLSTGRMLSFLPSASKARLLSTAAGHVENGGPGILHKRLGYIAFKLKRGIKF